MKYYDSNKNTYELNDKNFIASGGEGDIYRKGKVACKIYSDQKKVIPEDKIKELSLIKMSEVLAPIDVLYSTQSKESVGFTMPYINKTQFLCKLITTSFQKKNAIDNKIISSLVLEMRRILIELHFKEILVVDFNEMNFLVSEDFKVPYFIDVNSYQTKKYSATAIMESVKDPLVKGNNFNEGTDWFSFAVVTFQLFTGCHPYKGRHENYTSKEIASLKMMKDSLSVFHENVKFPPGSRDMNLIPSPLLKWYKNIFVNNDRSIPPDFNYSESTGVSPVISIENNNKLKITLVNSYEGKILFAHYQNGVPIVITEKFLYEGNNKKLTISQYHDPFVVFDDSASTVYCDFNNNENELSIRNDKDLKITIEADGVFRNNGKLYSVSEGKLFLHSFTVLNKVVHSAKVVGDIFKPSWEIFQNLVIQNIIGKISIVIPMTGGEIKTLSIDELKKHRVIDALFLDNKKGGVLIIVSEKDGHWFKNIFYLSGANGEYHIVEERLHGPEMLNGISLDNGLCITADNEGKIVASFDHNKIKIIHDTYVNSSRKLVALGVKALFINENELYQIEINE